IAGGEGSWASVPRSLTEDDVLLQMQVFERLVIALMIRGQRRRELNARETLFAVGGLVEIEDRLDHRATHRRRHARVRRERMRDHRWRFVQHAQLRLYFGSLG